MKPISIGLDQQLSPQCLGQVLAYFAFKALTFTTFHPHTALCFHKGVKIPPKPSDDKKTLPECHRWPPLWPSHPFSCQVLPASHISLENTLPIIYFSGTALPISSHRHHWQAPLVTQHSHGNDKSFGGHTWAILAELWRELSSHKCGRNTIFVLKKQSKTGWNTNKIFLLF